MLDLEDFRRRRRGRPGRAVCEAAAECRVAARRLRARAAAVAARAHADAACEAAARFIAALPA